MFSTTMSPWPGGELGGELVEPAGAYCARPGVARPRRRRVLARFADPFWVRDRARCRSLMWARAPRSAREASRVAAGVPSPVATTAAVFTPTSIPTAPPVGRLYASGAVVMVRSKHTEAYQDPPGSLLTMMFSIRARPGQQAPELGLRPARRAQGDPPVPGDPYPARLQVQTVSDRASPQVAGLTCQPFDAGPVADRDCVCRG
jgi:hypothetical protein